MRKASKYSPERLVAAANMFDILPVDAVPPATGLPSDFAATRDTCAAMLLKYPPGIDRNSALSALGRLGCEHASNIDQLFGGHGTVNQMVATPIGVQSGRRFTRS
jgi:hypothetical protein